MNLLTATAGPHIKDSEKCFTLNVNGECLDHLEYSKGEYESPGVMRTRAHVFLF